MRNLTAEQMEKMPSTEWFKKKLFKDNSITEKASKQKFYDISFTMNGNEKITGLWAIDLEEAKNKAWFKYWGCTNLQVTECTFNKK